MSTFLYWCLCYWHDQLQLSEYHENVRFFRVLRKMPKYEQRSVPVHIATHWCWQPKKSNDYYIIRKWELQLINIMSCTWNITWIYCYKSTYYLWKSSTLPCSWYSGRKGCVQNNVKFAGLFHYVILSPMIVSQKISYVLVNEQGKVQRITHELKYKMFMNFHCAWWQRLEKKTGYDLFLLGSAY